MTERDQEAFERALHARAEKAEAERDQLWRMIPATHTDGWNDALEMAAELFEHYAGENLAHVAETLRRMKKPPSASDERPREEGEG